MKNLFCPVALLIGIVLFIPSCGDKWCDDLSHVGEFHKQIQQKQKIDPEVNLYVDYSSCVVDANANSNFFKKIKPKLVTISNNYYSIKGKTIKKEFGDMTTLFAQIQDSSFADIQGAVHKITSANSQAILITDCEFIQERGNATRIDAPYLSDDFSAWLKKGFDIYMFVEDYVELVRGDKFNKHRYYFFFTDGEYEENIYNRISELFKDAPMRDVKVFHLSKKFVPISFDETYPQYAEVVSPNLDAWEKTSKWELVEFQTGWEDMYKYLLEAYDDNGNKLEHGAPVLKGLYINSVDGDVVDAFRVSKLGVNVYEVYEEYDKFINDTIPTKIQLGKPLKNVFVLDQDSLNEDNQIVMYLHPDFDGSGLSDEHPNLLRVDFVVEEYDDAIEKCKKEYFDFESTLKETAHSMNTSVYESLIPIAKDAKYKPWDKKEKQVLYTIYISTCNK